MKVHAASPQSGDQSSLPDRFQERGDVVSRSDRVPPDADLYIFYTDHEALRCLTQGLVVADLRHGPELETAGWLAYVDLCLVGTAHNQTALTESHGCEPERVYVAPDDDRLLDLVDKALHDVLPPAEVTLRDRAMDDPQRHSELATVPATPQVAALVARLEMAERQADVMLREYQVRSGVPLIGPLVAWVRRNLTSHLREPYLDPTLERQVVLNQELVKVLREMLPLLTDLEARLASMEEQYDNEQ